MARIKLTRKTFYLKEKSCHHGLEKAEADQQHSQQYNQLAGSDGTWVGKGGGRSANQPMLQPADGSNGTWIGRGGGRSPNQPIITPASLVQAQKCF